MDNMDGHLGLSEWPSSFVPNGTPNTDLGLTLSPGSQSSPCDSLFGSPLIAGGEETVANNPYGSSDPFPVESQGFDLDIDLDLGLEPNFDPFEGLHPTSAQSEAINQVVVGTSQASNEIATQPSGSPCKRVYEDVSSNGAQQSPPPLPPPKKQKLASQMSSDGLPAFLNPNQRQPSISSHIAPTHPPCPSASMISKEKFAIEPSDLDEHYAREVTTFIPPDTHHASPYQPVGYNPSTPSMHSKVVHVSNDTLHHRLANARRRADAVTADRNKLREALLQYTSVDPQTGKLGIHALESQLTTLRRVNTGHQRRAETQKEETQFWKQRFVEISNTYNSLLYDYKCLQSGLPSPPASSTSRPNSLSARSSPTNAAAAADATNVSNLASPVTSSSNQPKNHLVPSSAISTTISLSNSPTALPQDTTQVIDLTLDDDAENVSPQGSETVTPRENAQLTQFHRNIRQKQMKWLHSTESTNDAADRILNKLNPKHRTGIIEVGVNKCYNIIETQNGLRLQLGGPFKQLITTSQNTDHENPTICSEDAADLYNPTHDELCQMMEEELAGGSDELIETHDTDNENLQGSAG
ncbi:hypothetical protein N7478_012767 [Penicillium angulare]|uniref:uncharacterized protein n=1 Tax=Penicillium angulare TaxID=116970 RepID=UPI002540D0FF|nr:uncharacterized protein N7478_012767 [Penicillium angulare]KAJ5256663.1 hypothetical protein N7478_012767 [Penicillium angulare]